MPPRMLFARRLNALASERALLLKLRSALRQHYTVFACLLRGLRI